MDTIFEGMRGYEMIMMMLGLLQFFVSLVGLGFFRVKGRHLKYLLASFLITILMIGFPGIKKFKFMNAQIDLRVTVTSLQVNPADADALAKLEELLAVLEQTDNLRPETWVDLAAAHIAQGDTAEAQEHVATAQEINPDVQMPVADWVSIVQAQLDKKKPLNNKKKL